MLARAGSVGYEDEAFLNLVTLQAAPLLWFKFLSFARQFDPKFAAFILMLFRMGNDLKEFLGVMFIFLCMFISILYYRCSTARSRSSN